MLYRGVVLPLVLQGVLVLLRGQLGIRVLLLRVLLRVLLRLLLRLLLRERQGDHAVATLPMLGVVVPQRVQLGVLVLVRLLRGIFLPLLGMLLLLLVRLLLLREQDEYGVEAPSPVVPSARLRVKDKIAIAG